MSGTGRASKVTYVTLAGNEEANAAYDAAVSTVRASLGKTFTNWIDGRASFLAGFVTGVSAPAQGLGFILISPQRASSRFLVFLELERLMFLST